MPRKDYRSEYKNVYRVTQIKLSRVIEFYVGTTHKIQLPIMILYKVTLYLQQKNTSDFWFIL